MHRKGQLALMAILLAALLGAYASSMMFVGGLQLSNVTMESFTMFADKIDISGGPPSTQMAMDVVEGTPVVVMNSSRVAITNMCVRKVEEGRLEINATSAIVNDVTLKITKLVASAPAFEKLVMSDILEFVMSTGGNVTLADVEITVVYMSAGSMTVYGMELSVS